MESEKPTWLERLQDPKALAGIGGLVVVLVLALVWTAWRWGIAEERHELLEKKAAEGFLVAPSSTRNVRVNPRESRVIGIGGGDLPQRVDLLIAAVTSRYDRFRVSLARDDGTMLLHADRMVRDSNNDLRLSLNTSMLPAGRYRLKIDGYTRRGELEPFEEAALQVAGR